MPELNLFGGYYTHPSKPVSVQNSVNLIPVKIEKPAFTINALMGTRGITLLSTLTGSGRGGWVMSGVPFFVNGNSLYKVNSDGTNVLVGSINGVGRVSMADNGEKLCIVVPGGLGYVYDGSTLTQITDTDYRPSDSVVFKDGFFVFTASDGSVFFNSALNDPSNIDPLDFGTAEIDPDKIVTAHVDHNELFILGEETIEVFQNIGGSGFPFQRIQGAIISKGCFARFTPIEFDNTFVFVGGGKGEGAAIWAVSSNASATKISTDAIDNEVQRYTKAELSSAFSFSFSIDGQFIVGFTFQSDVVESATYCYNITSQEWFQIRSGLTENNWRIASMVKAFDKILVSDLDSGKIGFLDSVFTEYGETIIRERTTQPFTDQGESLYFPEIELFMEAATADLVTPDPQVRLSFSDDGGITFSAERSKSFGKVGQYKKRAIWRRNGRVPVDRVMRFVVTDPVKVNFLKLRGKVEVGYG